jgi:hypothetical protein
MAHYKVRNRAARIAADLTGTAIEHRDLATGNDVAEFYRTMFAVVVECLDAGEEDEEEDED